LIAAGVAGLGLLAASGVAFVRSHPAPAKLSLDTVTAIPSPTPSSGPDKSPCALPAQLAAGQYWIIGPDSTAGYRAHEKFGELEAPHEAVARTSAVSGFMVIEDATAAAPILTDGCVAVDVRTLTSIDKLPPPLPDATGRDQHYPDLFDTSRYPYVTFRPDTVHIPGQVRSGGKVTLNVSGQLTMRGNARKVTTHLDARLTGQLAELAGSFVINAPDFGIKVPGQPVVQPDVTIEFLLHLTPATS
jgi:hypothetical protein